MEPKRNTKNITGLSYRLAISPKWNLSVFGKYYSQYCSGMLSTSSTGMGDYVPHSATTGAFGYGAAGTWFIIKSMQAKLSYEKAYRLPTIEELFGDEDLEMGSIALRPENSDNFNLNLTWSDNFGKHGLYAEGSLIYRDTKDYIMRRTDSPERRQALRLIREPREGGHQRFNISLRYSFSHWPECGRTFNSLDLRNNERYVAGGTQQESLTYKARIPNQPYLFRQRGRASAGVTSSGKGTPCPSLMTISMSTASLSTGRASVRPRPSRWCRHKFSHNIGISYSIKGGKYNLSFECRNLTDERL